jgi:hypothetical protein
MILTLLDKFQETRLRKDWPAMRALLHSEARLESLAAVGSVLSADELVEAIRSASVRGLYTVKTWNVELARPKTGLAESRVRCEARRGSITDEARIWLATELDGLIWRMRIFHGRPDAESCLKENSIDLGL